MPTTMQDVMRPIEKDPRFPHAPLDWTSGNAEQHAQEEGLTLEDGHWETILALQEYFARNPSPRLRELRDALDERFHARGGIRHLYEILPKGPIAQGCRLAGLTPPAGTEDKSFGSVQ
ncbi:Sulfurtransferase [Gammaproteobacteria bacterium]